jgi:hypothetical protein
VGESHESYEHPLSPCVCVDRMLKCASAGCHPACARRHDADEREQNVIFPQSSVLGSMGDYSAPQDCVGGSVRYIRPVTMPLLLREPLLRDCIDTQ